MTGLEISGTVGTTKPTTESDTMNKVEAQAYDNLIAHADRLTEMGMDAWPIYRALNFAIMEPSGERFESAIIRAQNVFLKVTGSA